MTDLKAKISVMQAALDGKEIEFKPKRITEGWQYVNPIWNWDEFDYRIKVEPMEFWINVYGDVGVYQSRPHKTKDSAEYECRNSKGIDIKTIKVREVTE